MESVKKNYVFEVTSSKRLELLLNSGMLYFETPVEKLVRGGYKESRKEAESALFNYCLNQAEYLKTDDNSREDIDLYELDENFFTLVKAYSFLKEKIGLERIIISVSLSEEFLYFVANSLDSSLSNSLNRNFFCKHFPEFKKVRVIDAQSNKLLGVPLHPSKKQIRDAYLKKSREFHPDLNKSLDSQKNFDLVGKAYTDLMKPYNRNKLLETFREGFSVAKKIVKHYLSSRSH